MYLLSFSWKPGSQDAGRTYSICHRGHPLSRHQVAVWKCTRPWKEETCTQSSCSSQAASQIEVFLHRVGTSLLNTMVCELTEQ